MAKKINNSASQGNQYMQNLLGNRQVVPLGASDVQAESNPSSSVPISTPVVSPTPKIDMKAHNAPAVYSQPGFTMMNNSKGKEPPRENKVRASFTILPSDFLALKKIAYIEQKKFSNIISDLVAEYIQAHMDEYHQFEDLSSAEKSRANLD